MKMSRRSVVGLLVAVLMTALAGCGQGAGGSDPNKPNELTMWARSSTADYAEALIDEYNKTHGVKIKLTIVATDSFQQKVGAAAGAKSLPDLLASDVVYSPNYATQGIFADLSDRIAGLPFADKLVRAHIDATTVDHRTYAVPFKIDSSFIFYNKALFRRAGLDPDKPPKTYDEIYEAARKITALGGGIRGFYFPGNCAGCSSYTTFGVARAGDEPPISADGSHADIDTPAISDWLNLYKRLYEGGLTPSDVVTGDTSRQQEAFLSGKIGIWPNGSYSVPKLNKKHIDWGYIPLATADGSKTGTMVGGDVLGIASVSHKKDKAWDFIRWTLEDKAQIDIIAKSGALPVRTDLSENRYTAADPRMVTIAKGMERGYTPSSAVYGEAFNAPNGPWLTAVRGVVFNHKSNALSDGEKEIQSIMNGKYRP